MDIKSINQRLETIQKLKLKLEESINSDIEIINQKQRQLKLKDIDLLQVKKSSNNNKKNQKTVSARQKTEEEKRKLEYLKFRDENADVNFFKEIKPLIDQIPESNGSRYYKKFDVNIGIVADEFLYNSFEGVANFHYITRENYKNYTDKIDLFLLVTTWKGLGMEWKGLGNPNIRKHRRDMFEIIKHYRSNGIKTVFYSKEDPVNYDIFIELAQKCEYIFTTAEEKVEKYKKDCNNDNVSVLSFGVNPTYHNPIGIKKFKRRREVLFSGSWYDKYPHRIVDTERIFDGVLDDNRDLKIIDRNYELKLDRHFFPRKYVKYVSPAVDHNSLQKLHKMFDWAINFNSVRFSNTMFANRIYELQALGNILLSNYSLGVNNKFPNVFMINNRSEVKDILNSFTEEEVYQHQILGIRRVMSKETSNIRIAELLDFTNTSYEKYTRNVAVVVKNKTEAIKNMFERQTYKNRELILESDFNENVKNNFDIITFFDENKEYSEFYLEDMINAFKYTDSDYITKDAYYDGQEFISGVEHDYVDMVEDRYRTVFWSQSYTSSELLHLTSPKKMANGYSIDPFEFNNRRKEAETGEQQDYQLSVIVPTYNNGDHLMNKCFNSLKRSSMFDQMEIIIIDDGSTDNYTPKVINNLSRRYSNIKSYFFNDGGSGSASRPRNKGIEISTASYVTYLDPDNEAINDGYAALYEEISSNTYDFVVGNMLRVSDKVMNFDYYRTVMQFNGKEVLEGKNIHQYLINTSFKAMSIQALVMKRELVINNSLKMVDGAIGQDTLFFHELLLHSDRVKAINLDIHVYYAAVAGSVTNVITKDFFNKYLILERERISFLQRNNLLEGYMQEKFFVYFKNWYLKRLVQIENYDDLEESIDILYKIFGLYKKHIKTFDKEVAAFEKLYIDKKYEDIKNILND